MTSAFARDMEVNRAGQWHSSLEGKTLSRGLWPVRKKEDRECLDRPVQML